MAEEGGCHLSPRKSTVEPQAAFPRLTGLPGPAPPSSHSACRRVPGPRAVRVPPHLRLSLHQSWGMAPAPQAAGRLFLQVPALDPAVSAPQHRPPGHRRSRRPRPPPELPQAYSPSRGWGFGPPPLSAFVAAPSRTPPSLPLPPRPGGGVGEGFGWRPDARGLPGARGGEGRAEPRAAGAAAAEGEENGEELGGRQSGKEGS